MTVNTAGTGDSYFIQRNHCHPGSDTPAAGGETSPSMGDYPDMSESPTPPDHIEPDPSSPVQQLPGDHRESEATGLVQQLCTVVSYFL